MQINDVLLQLRCGTSTYPNAILLFRLKNLLIPFKTSYRAYRHSFIKIIHALIILTILLTSPICVSQSNSTFDSVSKPTFLTSEQRHQLRVAIQDSSIFADPYVEVFEAVECRHHEYTRRIRKWIWHSKWYTLPSTLTSQMSVHPLLSSQHRWYRAQGLPKSVHPKLCRRSWP